MNEIIDNVFISDLYHARDVVLLNQNKIKCVISLGCEHIERECQNTSVCARISFPSILDTPSTLIMHLFSYINQVIDIYRENNCNILIHCVHGQSRSVTILCGYMLHNSSYQTPINDILDIVRLRHASICINPGFLCQLHLISCCKEIPNKEMSVLSYNIRYSYEVPVIETYTCDESNPLNEVDLMSLYMKAIESIKSQVAPASINSSTYQILCKYCRSKIDCNFPADVIANDVLGYSIDADPFWTSFSPARLFNSRDVIMFSPNTEFIQFLSRLNQFVEDSPINCLHCYKMIGFFKKSQYLQCGGGYLSSCVFALENKHILKRRINI